MFHRIYTFYIIFGFFSYGKSSEISKLIEQICYKDQLRTVVFVNLDRDSTIFRNIQLPVEFLGFDKFINNDDELSNNQQNKLLVIFLDKKICSSTSRFSVFKKSLIIFLKNNEIYPKIIPVEDELNYIFQKTCLSDLISRSLLYREKESKLYRIEGIRKPPSYGHTFTEIDISQNSYFPLIKDLKMEYVIHVWVEEFIFPIFFTYKDKISNFSTKLGGFHYHFIKTLAESINAELIVEFKNFTKYAVASDNSIKEIIYRYFELCHEFTIKRQFENTKVFVEYFSNEMVYPLSTVRRTNFIYGQVFEYTTWIGVLLYWSLFVILCFYIEKMNFVVLIFDGVRYFINQDVRIPRRTAYFYKYFLIGSYLLNTIHSNMCGAYSKIQYFNGLRDDRIKILNNSDFNELTYSPDLEQNYLTQNAYILEPFQYEAFRSIQILRRNYNFLHEKVNNSKRMFLPLEFYNSLIQEEVNFYFLHCYSSGLMRKWKQDVAWDYFRGNLKCFEIENVNIEASYAPETIDNFLFPFTIIIGGLTISFIVFYIEILSVKEATIIICNFIYITFFICLIASNAFSKIVNLYD